MSTYHTTHGTVRYSGIRRYIVVSNGETVKRTDSFDTAHKVASKFARQGATIVDTTREVREAAASNRVCAVCSQSHVPQADWNDPVYKHRHWHCIPRAEREEISRQWRLQHDHTGYNEETK
jgi:hypothetical protein